MPSNSEIVAATKAIEETMLPFRARDGWDSVAVAALVAAEQVRAKEANKGVK